MIRNFHNCIPTINKYAAWAYCIVNVLLPGIGTWLTALSCFCLAKEINKRFMRFVMNAAIGFAQILLTPFIIGWVWSIYYGILLVEKSRVPIVAVVHEKFVGIPKNENFEAVLEGGKSIRKTVTVVDESKDNNENNDNEVEQDK